MKFKSITIAFFVFINLQLLAYSTVLAQENKTLDSLKIALKNVKHDTTRVRLYAELSKECELEDILKYTDHGVQLAEQNLKKCSLTDPLRKTYLKYLAKMFNNIGCFFYQKSDFLKALQCFEKSLNFSQKVGNKNEIAASLINVGNIYQVLGNRYKAFEYYNRSLKEYREVGNKFGMATCFGNIAMFHKDNGNINKALEYSFKALEINEKINNRKGIAFSLTTIGCIYTDQKNINAAFEYFQKSLNLRQEIEDKNGIAESLINIGSLYFDQKNTSKALEYYRKCLEIFEETGDKYGIATSFSRIGTVYQMKDSLSLALDFFAKSFKINQEIHNKEGTTKELINIGTIYSTKKKHIKALDYFKQALKQSRELGDPIYIAKSSKGLSVVYESQGKYKDAYQMHVLFKQMADSIKNDETHKSIVKNQLQYKFEKEALQLKQKQTEKEAAIQLANQKQLQRKNYLIYGSSGLFIITCLLAILFYRNYKQKQQNTLQQNIVLEQKLLRSQMNPHFIFNSLGIIHEYIQKNKTEQAGNYLIKFSKLMRLILENSRQEFVSLEKEIETLKYYLNLYQLVLQNGFTYQINIDESIDTETTCIPPMLAQPFIENALKHGIAGKNNGELFISFKSANDMIVFEVADNGIGYSRSQELKKEKSSKHKSLATQIVYERLENINRDKKKKIQINISDIVDGLQQIVGTRVQFDIPITYSV